MNKSNTKNLIQGALFIAALYLAEKEHFFEKAISHYIALIMIPIIICSLLFRKSAWAKPYYTSKYNILNAKYRHTQEFDFSKELLIDKFTEVLEEAKFSIIKVNKNTGDIFATSKISWWSWGENIYIHFHELNGKTTVNFCSACLFQVLSWGKNERNYEKILTEFEESLTV